MWTQHTVWNVWKTPLSKTTRHSLRGSFRPRSISRCPCSSTRTSRSKSSNGKRKQLRTRMSMNLYGLVPATATEIQRLLVCQSFTTAIKTSADSDVAASSFRKSSAASCSSHRLAIKHRSVSHTNQLLKKAVLQSYMDFPYSFIDIFQLCLNYDYEPNTQRSRNECSK